MRVKRHAILGVIGAMLAAGVAACGNHEGPGEVTKKELPAAAVSRRADLQKQALARLEPEAGARPSKQILFGDLHVHSTFSADAIQLEPRCLTLARTM